jgi:type IVB pilus formation R64 PilN family outer membrane protein
MPRNKDPYKMSKKNNTKSRVFITASALLGLTACGSTGGDWNSANGRNNDALTNYNQYSAGMQNIQDSGRPGNVNVDNGLYLADKGFRSGRGNPLPERFETATGVTINTSTPINIEEFSQIVEELTGLRVDYEDIRIGGPSASADVAETSDDPAEAVGQLLSRAQGTVVNPVDKTFRIRHTGKLSSVLDTVASRLTADWVYEGGRIVFKGPQTITYTIWALPSSTQTTSSVGGGGSTFGESGSANTSSSLSNDYWESIEQGITGLIPTGARYSVNKASGTVTVTGAQAVHLRVQDFIENENRRMSRQVAVKIDVIAFTQQRSDARSVSLDVLLSEIGTGVAFNAGAIVERGAGGSIAAGVSGNKGDTNTTLGALSRLGRVSIVQSQSVTAMNNTPTPVSITNERAYVEGSATETDPETGAQTTSITAGVINTGMNFVVTPRIMSGNQVVMNYTLNISELVALREFSSNDSTVQLPELASRNFMQTVNIDSGNSVIIASTDIQNTSQERVGPFDPQFWGLGGSRNFDINSTKILVMMTPVVVDGSNTPRVRR